MQKNSNVVIDFKHEILMDGNILTVYVAPGIVGVISEGTVKFRIEAKKGFTFSIDENNKIDFLDDSTQFGNLRAHLVDGDGNISIDMNFITDEYDLYSFLKGNEQRQKVEKELPSVVYDVYGGKFVTPDGMLSSRDTMHYGFAQEYKESWEALLDAQVASDLLTQGNIARINAEIDHLLDTREFDKIPELIKQRDLIMMG